MKALVASLGQRYVVNKAGKKTAVILPFAKYQRLLEDLHDLAVVAERRTEQPISLDEMRRRLRAHGLL
ncbi:MAG TPA: type II toxin-antitoxin system Phd/YefM family antitoxin [Terriglobia bacterium]|nr:type II toxin-antitoxin system Phd/YefM family antitoxin [Terriglobia bacterium]